MLSAPQLDHASKESKTWPSALKVDHATKRAFKTWPSATQLEIATKEASKTWPSATQLDHATKEASKSWLSALPMDHATKWASEFELSLYKLIKLNTNFYLLHFIVNSLSFLPTVASRQTFLHCTPIKTFMASHHGFRPCP